jgi:hypothetical protein
MFSPVGSGRTHEYNRRAFRQFYWLGSAELLKLFGQFSKGFGAVFRAGSNISDKCFHTLRIVTEPARIGVA